MNRDRIIEHFGVAFFDKIVVDLEKYAVLWCLSDFEQIDYYSVNCLFTCVSAKYGPCILKISPHLKVTMTEYHMLKDYDGNGLCKVYEEDVVNGVLLLERIVPGIQLRDEPDLDTRLDVFCKLFCELHKPPADKVKYPTYMDWVSRIAAYMRTRTDFKELSEKMTKAEEVCRCLWTKYIRIPTNPGGEMLLHGDLHHDNILLSEDGYRIIDPKGVVGDPVFDIPRFILNEDDLEKGDNFAYIVRTLEEKLDVPEQDIRMLFYVEKCMGNSWSVEDNDEIDTDDWDGVLFAERMMNKTSL